MRDAILAACGWLPLWAEKVVTSRRSCPDRGPPKEEALNGNQRSQETQALVSSFNSLTAAPPWASIFPAVP